MKKIIILLTLALTFISCSNSRTKSGSAGLTSGSWHLRTLHKERLGRKDVVYVEIGTQKENVFGFIINEKLYLGTVEYDEQNIKFDMNEWENEKAQKVRDIFLSIDRYLVRDKKLYLYSKDVRVGILD